MRYCLRPCIYHSKLVLLYHDICRNVVTKAAKKSPVFNRHVASVEAIHREEVTPTVADIKRKQPGCIDVEWEPLVTDWNSVPSYYMKLSKIRLTGLVVITTVAGYALAPAPFDWGTLLCCSLGTGLVSGAANAVNQYHEVPFDAQMSRTKNRVLVRSLLSPLHALMFATVASVSGLSILYFGCNSLTAILGASNLLLYTCIYTPLKRMSICNTWVGSVVGALPPVMGWAACNGAVDPGALILAGILYAWQFPHFNALSWNLRPDYSRAGYRMMAVTNPGLCRRTTLRYTAVIAALSTAAPFCDMTNLYFALEAVPLNVYFMYLAWRFYKESDSANSRKLFRFSLLHLPLLMALLLVNKKHWFFLDNSSTEVMSATLGAASTTGAEVPLLPVTLPDSPISVQKKVVASL